MRRGGACVLVLWCVCLGGCLSGDPARPSNPFNHPYFQHSNLGPDGVLLDMVVVERSLGDPFLNNEIWSCTDTEVTGLDKKAVLDDNGICVGEVVGMNPAKLQNLIDTERNCVTSRRQLLPAGTATAVALGPTVAQCSFRLKAEDGAHDVALEQGQCTFNIVPTLTEDGRTRLKFTPQVLYGNVVPDYQVAPDRSGFLYNCKRHNKTYDALSWEVTLAPNQYLIVGTHFDENASDDMQQSLGNQFFLVDKTRTYSQRILVIRTTRGSGETGGAASRALPGQVVTPAALCVQ